MRIWLAAGTSEALEVARLLKAQGHAVTGSVAQEAAAGALAALGVAVSVGRRDAGEFREILRAQGCDAVVDAAHPFAGRLHRELREAAGQAGIPYLRFERESTQLPDHPRVHPVPDAPGAARLAASFGGTVFLTTGVRDAAEYRRAAEAAGVRVVARVLPLPESVAALLGLGFRPEDVVALQGPFGEEVNAALFRHFGARVLVAKESGPRGSLPEKIRAALSLDMESVVVHRPQLPPAPVARTAQELVDLLALRPRRR